MREAPTSPANAKAGIPAFNPKCSCRTVAVANALAVCPEGNECELLASGRWRPTAIFAAGFYFALDCYGAAATVGLRIPDDISIVGVDDPPSAMHLSPPLTTLRQPLMQLGHAAITALHELIQRNSPDVVTRTLWAELVIRRSSAAVK